MPDPEGLKPARVFLALWPDVPIRKRLAQEGRQLHDRFHGRLTRQETIHLTLAFIGNLDRERLPALVEGLKTVSVPAFEVVFDRAGCWKHNKIAYLSSEQPPEALLQLVKGIESALVNLDVPFDRRPFKTHITLIRKADCTKGNPAQGRVPASPEWGGFTPIAWSVKEFVLVESVLSAEGASYQVVGRFPLS